MAATLAVIGMSARSSLVKADDLSLVTVSAMSTDSRHDIERRVDEIANHIANAKSYFENDKLPIHIKSSFDPVAQSLVMSIDERFGPVSGLVEMEELQSDVTYAVWPMLEQIQGFWGLDWRYGGKDMYFWFPRDRRPPEKRVLRKATAEAGLGSVLINEGHGYYYHHGYRDWRFQREPANGIIEDEITAEISTPLWGWMTLAGVDVKVAKEASFGNHIPSGKPLYLMATRYLLERSLPDRPDIWHSLPDDTSDLREYKEDIRSRPLYANSLGVDAMISIHTNASDNASAHGTTVIVQPGRPESAQLASMALCYMREHIQAKEEYADFSVARTPLLADKGENRLAAMPSIIVELAFHTNSSDAAALKDPLFLASATRGLTKGFRLYRAGKNCEEFSLDVPRHVQGLVGDVAKIPVGWLGYPAFPITVDAELKECDDGSWCGVDSEFVAEENEGRRVDLGYRCMKEDVEKSPFAVTVSAEDIDVVKTKAVEIMVSCTAPPEKSEAASAYPLNS
jgi:hypothetical protein